MPEEEKDYYAILEIPPIATQEEIRQAYRKLARRYHPDSHSEEASAEKFQEVHEAYSVLGNPGRRQAYDQRRARRGRDVSRLPWPGISWSAARPSWPPRRSRCSTSW